MHSALKLLQQRNDEEENFGLDFESKSPKSVIDEDCGSPESLQIKNYSYSEEKSASAKKIENTP